MTHYQQSDTGLSQNGTGQTDYQSDPYNPYPEIDQVESRADALNKLLKQMGPIRSDDIGALMLALAKAQGEFPEIERNRTVRVQPRSGGTPYEFKYATLSAIVTAIRKPLANNELAWTQIISHDGNTNFYVLTTTLYYGNQFISSVVPIIVEGSTNQQFGSALTYMKRYTLTALLGISADDDDDGNAADGNEIKAVTDKKPKAPAPDPITSGPQPKASKPPGDDTITTSETEFNYDPIEVPMFGDGSGSDWMTWGQQYIAQARIAPDKISLEALEEHNRHPFENMKQQAPKMHTNLTLAMIKIKKALEK